MIIILEKIQIEKVFQNKFNHYIFQPSCRLSEIHNSFPLTILTIIAK